MSGALKHFFDTIYYPCLEATAGRPFGVYVHGNDDTAGALRAIDKITTGLHWAAAQVPVSVVGAPTKEDRDACWELGAALAAGLMPDG
jgi:multimeric flavodoxin WrbA